MASGPITSWQIEGKKVETVTDFIFVGSKITADGDCSREIKRHFLLGKKTITNLESESEVSQSCPTLCNPMDCSLPGYSIPGIFQAVVLEQVAISFSRGSSPPRDQTWVSCIVERRFTIWATREVTNLDSMLKSKDIALLTKVHIVKAMVFPVVMYRCESWAIKMAVHWRIDAFE